MSSTVKVVGKSINQLKIDAPANGSTILSELKIKNTSYPTNVDVMVSDSFTTETYVSPIADFTKGVLGTSYDARTDWGEMAVDSNGYIYSLLVYDTYSELTKRTPSGELDESFNQGVSILGHSRIELMPDGSILLVSLLPSNRNTYVKVLNSDGTLNAAYTQNLEASILDIATGSEMHYISAPSVNDVFIEQMKVLSDGSVIGLMLRDYNAGGGIYDSVLFKLKPDFTIDTDNYGFLTEDASMFGVAPQSGAQIREFVIDNDENIVVFKSLNGGYITQVFKLASRNLLPDSNYGSHVFDNHFVTNREINIWDNNPIVFSDNSILVPLNRGGGHAAPFLKIKSDGTLDDQFYQNWALNKIPYGSITSIAIDSQDRLYIYRFGNLGTSVRVQQVEYQTTDLIIRLNPNGLIDSSFDYVSVNNAIHNKDLTSEFSSLYVSALAINSNDEPVMLLIDDGPYPTPVFLKYLKQYFLADSADYLIKNKPLSYDEEIHLSGGIAMNNQQSLVVETTNYNSNDGNVIIQAYGIEETA